MVLFKNLRDPETGAVSKREIFKRLRSAVIVVACLGLFAYGGSIAAAYIGERWNDYRTADDFEGNCANSPGYVEITIPNGASGSAIADLLVENEVVKTTKAFIRELGRHPEGTSIQFGRWKLCKEISSAAAVDMLLDNSNQVHDWLTLREGLWLTDYAKTMAEATNLPEEDFLKALTKQTDKLGLPSYAKEKKNAEGFIFPESYDIGDNPTVLSVIKMATKQFAVVAKELNMEERADELKVSQYKIVIIASIIEREVNRDEDRPKAARVIYNRLKADMPLQMDSTVAYAVKKSGVIATTQADREVDSKYNTYKYKGLPPGPISNPGRKALEAALNPSKGDWLYWVVVNPETGETQFSDTYAEHQQGVAKYQAWCNESAAHKKVCFGE
ncbi:MAG: endolytic transglycosylase MltG [Propionibacteriaceae bacterium]|jgi:UPF0755 protein|nr:endolytic transglycosylase MltG [Propionibacteriaceae bacterium]